MKKETDVMGYKINCPNYEKCPICFGCRAYDSKYIKCSRCEKNFKFNICDKQKHRSDLISKLVNMRGR